MEDKVYSPAHYTFSNIECIDAIRAALTPEEFRGFCKGNMLKYVWRERHKGGTESIRKSRWYAAQIIEAEEAERSSQEAPAPSGPTAPTQERAVRQVLVPPGFVKGAGFDEALAAGDPLLPIERT